MQDPSKIKHTHALRNEVMLVWGLLRLAPIIIKILMCVCVCVTEVGCSWGRTRLVTRDLRTSIYRTSNSAKNVRWHGLEQLGLQALANVHEWSPSLLSPSFVEQVARRFVELLNLNIIVHVQVKFADLKFSVSARSIKHQTYTCTAQ